jgi:hypothetical protein
MYSPPLARTASTGNEAGVASPSGWGKAEGKK